MQKQRRGFTLVELLVVIAIIAVLIAILLPGLNKAKQAANRVACSSNMHQVALAIVNYAQGNKGKLPVFGGAKITSLATLYSTNQLNDLVDGNYITAKSAGTLVYDPAFPPGELFDYGGVKRASYYWNPHPGDSGAPAPGLGAPAGFAWPNAVFRWQQLSQIPRGRVLGIDIIHSQGSTAHRSGSKAGDASWNLCYPDGHVSNVPSRDLFLKLNKDLKSPQGWAASWPLLNDSIRVLELIDQGKNPKMADGGYYYWEPAGGAQTNVYYPPARQGQPAEDVQ